MLENKLRWSRKNCSNRKWLRDKNTNSQTPPLASVELNKQSQPTYFYLNCKIKFFSFVEIWLKLHCILFFLNSCLNQSLLCKKTSLFSYNNIFLIKLPTSLLRFFFYEGSNVKSELKIRLLNLLKETAQHLVSLLLDREGGGLNERRGREEGGSGRGRGDKKRGKGEVLIHYFKSKWF